MITWLIIYETISCYSGRMSKQENLCLYFECVYVCVTIVCIIHVSL